MSGVKDSFLIIDSDDIDEVNEEDRTIELATEKFNQAQKYEMSNYIRAYESYDESFCYGNHNAIIKKGLFAKKNKDYNTALSSFELGADYNIIECIYNLAIMYLYGIGVSKDYEEAFRLFTIGHENNNSLCTYQLGEMYFYGKIPFNKNNYEKAFEFFSRAYEFENDDAMYMLGYIYELGLCGNQSYDLAFKYYSEGSGYGEPRCLFALYMLNKKGHIEGDYFKYKTDALKVCDRYLYTLEPKYYEVLGKIYHDDSNDIISRDYLMNGIKLDNTYSIFMIAKYHITEGRKEMGIELLEKGIKLLNFNSVYLMATIYYNDKEYDLAFKLLSKYSHLNYHKIFNMLGDMYINGHGTSKNYINASREYLKSIKLNNVDAMIKLALINILDVNIKNDNIKAFEYLTRAVQNRSQVAKNYLAHLYRFGIGTMVDNDIASDLYHDCDDFNSIGEMYLEMGNYEMAYKYFVRGDGVNTYCTYNLAKMYRYGMYVKRNHDIAIELLRKGYKNKNPQCCYELGLLCYFGIGTKLDRDFAKTLFNECYNICLERINRVFDPKIYSCLGDLYRLAYVMDYDYNRAIKYYNYGIKFNEGTSYFGLLKLYISGELKLNDFQVNDYVEKGIKYDINRGYHIKGYMIMNGIFFNKSDDQAIECFSKSKTCFSQLKLGNIYRKRGEYEKALECYNYCIVADYDNALYELYLMYKNGLGVEKNITTAYEYLDRAVDKKHKDAIYDKCLLLVDIDRKKMYELLDDGHDDRNCLILLITECIKDEEYENMLGYLDDLLVLDQKKSLELIEDLLQVLRSKNDVENIQILYKHYYNNIDIIDVINKYYSPLEKLWTLFN